MTTNDPFEGVPALLATAMQKRGFTDLTAVQRAVLEAECEGRDLRISSQTGSGKTVALGLALARHFMAPGAGDGISGPAGLVIVPTRELAMQVREELRWLYEGIPGVRVEVVTGGTDLVRERRSLAQKPGIVVGTPGRMLDHIRTGALVCESVEHVVLDEADQMFDMGFREELEGILEALPEERRSHLLSATFPPQVRNLANRFQRDALHLEGTRLGAANADIEHVAHMVRPNEWYAAPGEPAADDRRRAHARVRATPRGHDGDSPSDWPATASSRCRSRATSRRASERARSMHSATAACRSSSRPTSPRAASTCPRSRP